MSKHYREKKEREPGPVLGVCGIIIALGGIFFMFIQPGEETELGMIANFHRLAIGQTLMICGTILIAVQWRPR